jgi:hypothetical protein
VWFLFWGFRVIKISELPLENWDASLTLNINKSKFIAPDKMWKCEILPLNDRVNNSYQDLA